MNELRIAAAAHIAARILIGQGSDISATIGAVILAILAMMLQKPMAVATKVVG